MDEANLISARRWCWRQSAQSASREDTIDVLVTVEGHHEAAEGDVRAALEDLLVLLMQYAGGENMQSAVLSPEKPSFG